MTRQLFGIKSYALMFKAALGIGSYDKAALGIGTYALMTRQRWDRLLGSCPQSALGIGS